MYVQLLNSSFISRVKTEDAIFHVVNGAGLYDEGHRLGVTAGTLLR